MCVVTTMWEKLNQLAISDGAVLYVEKNKNKHGLTYNKPQVRNRFLKSILAATHSHLI